MYIIDQLKKSHERHRAILERCEYDPIAYEEFRNEVQQHVHVKETLFFPAIIALEYLTTHVKRAWGSHAELSLHLQKIDALEKEHPEWTKAFGAMKELYLGRIDEEERTLFPLVMQSNSGLL